MESSAGGKKSHLLRPCPTPMAPDVWPVASSKAGGVFGGDGRGGRDGRGRGVRAGRGADVTCPSLLFVFQVRYVLSCCACFSGGIRIEGGMPLGSGTMGLIRRCQCILWICLFSGKRESCRIRKVGRLNVPHEVTRKKTSLDGPHKKRVPLLPRVASHISSFLSHVFYPTPCVRDAFAT